jgi:hypothetical protein
MLPRPKEIIQLLNARTVYPYLISDVAVDERSSPRGVEECAFDQALFAVKFSYIVYQPGRWKRQRHSGGNWRGEGCVATKTHELKRTNVFQTRRGFMLLAAQCQLAFLHLLLVRFRPRSPISDRTKVEGYLLQTQRQIPPNTRLQLNLNLQIRLQRQFKPILVLKLTPLLLRLHPIRLIRV